MDCCLSYPKPKLSFPVLPSLTHRRPIAFKLSIDYRPLIVSCSTNGTSKCDYGGLNTPLEPKSQAGRFLSGVVLDDRDNFQVAARKELEGLAAQRDEAVARFRLSIGSDEACLHRRIAELKAKECQVAVEEVIYMLIFHKFSDIKVHLLPRLSKCVYKSRLEIWPSKEWELESIHTSEALDMVREHVSVFVGPKANANVTDGWTKTFMQHDRLYKLYTDSISYGYFLKSAALRHKLEWGPLSRSQKIPVSEMLSLGSEYITFGRISSQRSPYASQLLSPSSYSITRNRDKENLRFYVMGFDQEAIEMCSKVKSKEALNLIKRHCWALFGDENEGSFIEKDEMIITSFASLKRFVLEGVAFGSFLWDAEKEVSGVYMLEENE